MEIVSSKYYSKHLIGSFVNENGLITAQWGSDVIIKKNDGSEKIINTFCTGLLKIHSNNYLCLTSNNNLLQIDQEGKVEQIDSQRSQYFVTAFYMKTCLFMHNTIQQQRYLTLWNMITQQKQNYQHVSNITSVVGADAGIWIGDQEGYLNLVSYKLRLMKRLKVFENEVTQVLVIQQRIYCVSRNCLKIVYQDAILSVSNFDNEISCVCAYGNKIILGLTNGELIIQKTMKKFETHKVHTNSITSLSIYENKLVTTSFDRTVLIMKLQ